MDWNDYLRMFVGLFAIINPIGAIPLYLSFTDNIQPERKKVARTAAVAVAIIITVTMVIGLQILNFFSISVDAFRVAGGILLMSIAFSMLEAKRGRVRHTPEEDEEAMDSSSVAVVPLALPLLVGPGAISTVILFSNQASALDDKFALFIIGLLIALTVWIILHLAPYIGNRISKTSMNILTRVMGLILAAMSVEFVVTGLRNLLPGLAG
jgi:multiple antibiotic resistance protein